MHTLNENQRVLKTTLCCQFYWYVIKPQNQSLLLKTNPDMSNIFISEQLDMVPSSKLVSFNTNIKVKGNTIIQHARPLEVSQHVIFLSRKDF